MIKYIFDEYGTSIFNGTESILEDGETAEYYTLVPIKNVTDYYHYVIGYVHNKLLYFLYYKYKFSSKINSRTTSRKAKQHKDKNNNAYYIENKGLSCQYMHDYNNLDILVCFFCVKISSKFNIIIDYYSAKEAEITYHDGFYPYNFQFPNITCIKSVLSPDLSKSFVAMYSSTGIPHYFIYDINIEYSISNFRYFTIGLSHCRNQFHGLIIIIIKKIISFLA